MSRKDDLVQEIADLKDEIAKLNIILYHRENGLSHPDLQGEIDKSILAEENKRLREEMNQLIDIAMKIRRNVIAQTNRIVGRPKEIK